MSMERMLEELSSWFSGKRSAIVAFSGGVDSSVLAKVAFDSLGDRTVAVTFDSPIMARSDLENAREVAREIGIEHEILEIDLLGVPGFKDNPEKRCYLCKGAISGELKGFGKKRGIDLIVEGSNADDVCVDRPGMKALEEAGIRSPFLELGFGKEEIRRSARELGLSTHSRPSGTCLATRIPFCEEVSLERLGMIERGEEILKEMGFGQVRLRHHGEVARIEVDGEEFERVIGSRKEISNALKNIGFIYITLDMEGYGKEPQESQNIT